jgi:hypothetical protein
MEIILMNFQNMTVSDLIGISNNQLRNLSVEDLTILRHKCQVLSLNKKRELSKVDLKNLKTLTNRCNTQIEAIRQTMRNR